MGTTPAQGNQIISKRASSSKESIPIREQSIPLFRNSPEYEKFVQLIGRNRKYIQEEIEKFNKEKTAFIPFANVESIISNFSIKHGLNVDASMVRNLIAFSMTG